MADSTTFLGIAYLVIAVVALFTIGAWGVAEVVCAVRERR